MSTAAVEGSVSADVAVYAEDAVSADDVAVMAAFVAGVVSANDAVSADDAMPADDVAAMTAFVASGFIF